MAREKLQRKRVGMNPTLDVERWITREELTVPTSRHLVLMAGLVALSSLSDDERRHAYRLAGIIDRGHLTMDHLRSIQDLHRADVEAALERLQAVVLSGASATDGDPAKDGRDRPSRKKKR